MGRPVRFGNTSISCVFDLHHEVVHSTDFAVVRDNVAHKTKGHSYFTEASGRLGGLVDWLVGWVGGLVSLLQRDSAAEAGDEVFTLYEHNLAVHPLQYRPQS